jgi:hypothetical protein
LASLQGSIRRIFPVAIAENATRFRTRADHRRSQCKLAALSGAESQGKMARFLLLAARTARPFSQMETSGAEHTKVARRNEATVR